VSGIRRQWRNLIYRRVLHADDSPNRIALGIAIATFVAFLPIMGIQTVVAVTLAAIARANKAVCIPIVWITNPFTALPVYGSCWWLGRTLLTGSPEADPAALQRQLAIPQEYSGLGMFTHVFEAAFWKFLFTAMLNFTAELWLGCAVVGIVAAVILYFGSRRGIITYRRRRAARKARRTLVRPSIRTVQAATPTREPVYAD